MFILQKDYNMNKTFTFFALSLLMLPVLVKAQDDAKNFAAHFAGGAAAGATFTVGLAAINRLNLSGGLQQAAKGVNFTGSVAALTHTTKAAAAKLGDSGQQDAWVAFAGKTTGFVAGTAATAAGIALLVQLANKYQGN